MERTIELSRELDILHKKEPEVYKSYTQMYKLFDIIKEITQESGGQELSYMPIGA